jgi:hypothetical protein
MRLHDVALVMVLGLGAPAMVVAQTTGTTPQTGTTTGQTGTTDGTTAAPAPQMPSSGNGMVGPATSRWIASGFVGSNFGASATSAAADFGGSFGYVWNSWVGAEFLANFTPNFQIQNPALFNGRAPQVNTYMFNAVGSVPFGADGQWLPFVSGGAGAVTLRSGALNGDTTNVFTPDDSKAGGNIGFGLMGFMGNWGVRGDIRYFRAFSSTNTSTPSSAANAVANSVLPGLDFWRANIGVAFRW